MAKRDGEADRIPELARQAAAYAAPVDRNRLVDRLTALGMVMAPNRPMLEATVWVRETARLLGDLPEAAVCEAIDAHQRECKFLPTVAEIRERAEPTAARLRKEASRLDAMARLIASGADVPAASHPHWEPARKPEPVEPCTPEQAAAIIAEFNLKPATQERLRKFVGEPRKPTRADYIELGVDPAILDGQLGEAA